MSLPPAIEPLRCTNPDCLLPEGGACARAAEFDDPTLECPLLARQDGLAQDLSQLQEALRERLNDTEDKPPLPNTDAAPWSGRHLDEHTTEQLLWRSPARVIAVMGPHNAGKTSYLASLFLQLSNRQCRQLPYRFASSQSLFGMHEILDKIRAWDQSADRGTAAEEPVGQREIIAHTPKQSGLLHFMHLGLRPAAHSDNRHIDVLLSDVAGEYFTEHASRENPEMQAFLARCDGFLIVADTGKLVGKRGRQHDAEIARIIRRVTDLTKQAPARKRAVALCLCKYDLVVDQDHLPPAPEQRAERTAWGPVGDRARKIWTALDQLRPAMPVRIFPVSAFPRRPSGGQPVGVDAPLAYLMQHLDARTPWPRPVQPVPEGCSSFLAMRRWSDQP